MSVDVESSKNTISKRSREEIEASLFPCVPFLTNWRGFAKVVTYLLGKFNVGIDFNDEIWWEVVEMDTCHILFVL